jgi:RNA recognition motif-containing protein
MKNIYVGNLSFKTTKEDLEELFAPYGEVQAVNIISDRETGRSRGFGFVEMDDAGADKAIEALNGKDVGGRNLRVNLAKEKERGGRRDRD